MQFGTRFCGRRRLRNVENLCGRRRGRHLITAARTNGLGVICRLKKLHAGTNKHYGMHTDRLITRPRRDWSAGLAAFKIFCRQLCKKVRMRPMKDGLEVRIYNLRKGGSYASLRSESRGPFYNWFVVHVFKYFADFASVYVWSLFRLFQVPCSLSQDIPLFLTTIWYVTSENEVGDLESLCAGLRFWPGDLRLSCFFSVINSKWPYDTLS